MALLTDGTFLSTGDNRSWTQFLVFAAEIHVINSTLFSGDRPRSPRYVVETLLKHPAVGRIQPPIWFDLHALHWHRNPTKMWWKLRGRLNVSVLAGAFEPANQIKGFSL